MKQVIAAAGAWWLTRDISVAVIGVPLNVLFACAIGAFCSFSFADEKVRPRSKMWGLFVACMFMGGAFTAFANAIVDHFTDLAMTDALKAAMGAIVSFITRFWLPWLVDVIRQGKWVAWVPFLGEKK